VIRRIVVPLCVAVFASGQQPSWRDVPPTYWGPLINGWQVALLSEGQQYSSGAPIVISLALRNGSAKPLTLWYDKSPWYRAIYGVMRLDDNQVISLRPPADEFERLRRWCCGKTLVWVDPGRIRQRAGEVDLLDLFDLGPGTYLVTTIYRLPDSVSGKYVPVPSNTIRISIVK
jgi:hypothetical protein